MSEYYLVYCENGIQVSQDYYINNECYTTFVFYGTT